QQYFPRPDDTRLAIAGRNLDTIIEVDDVLPAGCRMPIQVIGGWHFPENNPGGREALGESPSRGGLDIFHVRLGKVRFTFVVGIESVDFHRFPPVRYASASMPPLLAGNEHPTIA